MKNVQRWTSRDRAFSLVVFSIAVSSLPEQGLLVTPVTRNLASLCIQKKQQQVYSILINLRIKCNYVG